ncbi:MAG: hydrogenase maturation protease [Nitrososphaerota archaeon]
MRGSSGKRRAVVACIGVRFRGDDGAGLCVADLLSGLAGADVVRLQTPAELLNHLTGDIDLLVVVDAVEKLTEAGAIHRLDSIEKISRISAWRSTHTMTLPEVIGLAETLGIAPSNIVIYGIEGERFDEGSGLSEAVERACRTAASEIRRLIQGWSSRVEA